MSIDQVPGAQERPGYFSQLECAPLIIMLTIQVCKDIPDQTVLKWGAVNFDLISREKVRLRNQYILPPLCLHRKNLCII